MILELNLNEATVISYEPECEEFESTELIIPITNNIKLVISGVRGSDNNYNYTIPPMANFVELEDEEEDEDLEESIKLVGNNKLLNECTYVLVDNKPRNSITDYI